MHLKDTDLPEKLQEYINETITRVHAIQKELERLDSRNGAIAVKNLLMIPLGSLNKHFDLPPNTLEGFKRYLSEERGYQELKRINFQVALRLKKGPAPAANGSARLTTKIYVNEKLIDNP